MAFKFSTLELQQQRIQALVTHFEGVQRERMHGVPILNLALSVKAVGFVFPQATHASGVVGEGVLITPWFMSLIRLPLYQQKHAAQVGLTFVRQFGGEKFDFIGAYAHELGYYETCALFSPMGSFSDDHYALETAQAALAEIRSGVVDDATACQFHPEAALHAKAPVAAPIANPKAAQPGSPPNLSRRFFFTGRASRSNP